MPRLWCGAALLHGVLRLRVFFASEEDTPLRMTSLEKALALAGGGGQNYLGGWAQVPDNSTGENQAYSDKLSAA